MYRLKYTPDAEGDLRKIKKDEPATFKKVVHLLDELMEHPTTGTGHSHQLSSDRVGQWSRSITKKHRSVYQVNERHGSARLGFVGIRSL